MSVAACLEYLFGRHPEPDDIRDWCYGENWKGYTFPGDMARYLWWVAGVDAEVVVIDAPQDIIANALAQGRPVLARTWEEGRYFHWTPLTAIDSAWITRHQVLGGYLEKVGRSEWLRRYAGWLLIVTQVKSL